MSWGSKLSVLTDKMFFSFHGAEEVRAVNTSAEEDDVEKM